MQNLQRLRTLKSSVWRSVGMPELKKRASNSWCAVEDTYYSTKDTFERHRVVFTVGTSIASVGTAWLGYTFRHLHDTRVDRRLDSIEQAMKSNYQIEREEIQKIVGSGSYSTAACAATAGTTLVIGYALGWRGGKWYTNRKFRREQMKLLGQVKPRRWRLHFLKRPNLQSIRIPLLRNKSSKDSVKSSEALQKESKDRAAAAPSIEDGVTWLLNPPDQSLAFILADSGFDVWVANSRGTKYSLGHMTLSFNDSAYWDWSWDELMEYDLPEIVQYVYNQSGEQKLHYVGHSQVIIVIVVYGLTVARDGTIARYDYLDPNKNKEQYGQAKPPEYDLTNIPNNLPLFIAHGGRDELADVDDVKFLLDNLKNHDRDKFFLHFIEDYAHADYVLAMNAKEFVYDRLMDFFRKVDQS
ncbi:hypothetical protein SOVF_050990 [Spinacia oleracea]|nr:hypothetical protein SOVF_050990 [Spinacia oleracea]